MGQRLIAVLMLLFGLWTCLSPEVSRHWRAAELLLALSSEHKNGAAGELPPEIVSRDLWLPGRHGAIRARVYQRRQAAPGRGLVLAHGVHKDGIDEKRLVPFAAQLARAGLVVMTPELRDLADYRITEHSADTIADSVSYLSRRRDLVSSSRVGVLGFSFAGGLSLVAASRSELDGKLSYVASVGGHHDLERVLRFFVSDEIATPEGVKAEKAHEYGLAVLVYGHMQRFAPAEDAALLSEQRLKELRPEVEALIADEAPQLAQLSPHGKLDQLGVPVYLLHGSTDSVIPPSESRWADREIETDHVALISPLLTHVEVDKGAGLRDQLELVDFMARML